MASNDSNGAEHEVYVHTSKDSNGAEHEVGFFQPHSKASLQI